MCSTCKASDEQCVCAPTPWLSAARLSAEEWEIAQHLLMVRSGGQCEVRSTACEAPGGRLAGLTRDRISIHHRKPRGMGGTTLLGANDLSVLLIVCGDGVRGCHGAIESERHWALGRGLLVPQAWSTEDTPLTLYSGRRVLLDPASPFYLPLDDGMLGWRHAATDHDPSVASTM